VSGRQGEKEDEDENEKDRSQGGGIQWSLVSRSTCLEETDPPAARPAAVDRPLAAWTVVQVVLLAAGWGGNAPALRFSLHYLPPLSAAGIRFLIGLAVIVLFARIQGVSLRARRSEWRPLAWMGLLFTVQIVLLNLGSAHTAASRQALLINSYPVFVPVLAHLFLPHDRLTWNKGLGTLLAFAGVVVIFGEKLLRGGGGIYGDLLVSVSAVLLAAKAVYTSALVRSSHPYEVLFWQMVLAVPCFFTLSLMTEPQQYRWSPAVLVSLLYQGAVVAGLCFVGWTSLLRHYAPTRLSVGFFLTPVFGALFSYLLLGEPITGGLLAGGIAILLGLLLVNRRRSRNE
jgi:drug/metabolite transporter (DMT)-like permease